MVHSGDRTAGPDPGAEFAQFFKALADVQRIQIVATIADEPRTVLEIASALALPPRRVLNQLETLMDLGFVTSAGDGVGARYAWNEARVRAIAKEKLESPRVRALAGATDERSKVLASFVRDGRLVRFPTGDARKLVILEYVMQRFDSSRAYGEREVNAILKEFAEDYATIRRALVDYVFLNRHEGVYWVAEGRRGRGAGAEGHNQEV